MFWHMYTVIDRTGELRKLGFATRHLGPVQMTTDTAVNVSRRVVEGKSKCLTGYQFPPRTEGASYMSHNAAEEQLQSNKGSGSRRSTQLNTDLFVQPLPLTLSLAACVCVYVCV